MTAAACLQILVGHARVKDGKALLPTIAKVTIAFLDSRWSWPKRYTQISATSYMLTDPSAKALNSREVQDLSAELQTRLFGRGESGDVQLALFEGSTEDATKFAQLPMAELLVLLNAEELSTLGLHGRILKVSANRIEVLKNMEEGDLEIWSDALESLESAAPPRVIFRGLYLTPKQLFVASIASRWRSTDKVLQSIINGPAHYPRDQETFDRETIEALCYAYPDPRRLPGIVHVPMSFTNLSRRGVQDRYTEYLGELAKWPRELLVAEIYDTPRMLSHHALKDIKRIVSPRVSAIDLMITDPDTELSSLEPGLVRSVTLALPSGDDGPREAAIRRFMSHRDIFREKHIWPIIGNVRSRQEMQVCNSAHAPFMHGPGITGILEKPMSMADFMLAALPMNGHPAAQAS